MDIRERILESASEKYLLYGIRNITMDTLAIDLGVSKRTIYEHFTDKESLVVETFAYLFLKQNKINFETVEQAENAIEAIFKIISCNKKNMENLTPIFMEDMKKYLPKVNRMYFANDEFIKQHSASYHLLEKGLKEKVFRSEIKIDLIDVFFQELHLFIFNNDRIRVLNPSEEDIRQNIFLPFLRGICTAKGVKLMEYYFEKTQEENTNQTNLEPKN